MYTGQTLVTISGREHISHRDQCQQYQQCQDAKTLGHDDLGIQSWMHSEKFNPINVTQPRILYFKKGQFIIWCAQQFYLIVRFGTNQCRTRKILNSVEYLEREL